jgi:lipopolysaccharide transport system ATP-binding protein
MQTSDIAIKVENISKCYRIGVSEEVQENFAQAAYHFLKKPISNYKKYRSLYTFDEATLGGNGSGELPKDIIWALRDVSFEVARGEVLGIVGRNGAGKSTLLKVLSRITNPTTGKALIRGRISSLLEVGTGFHPELSGRENVYLNATILGMRKKEVDRKFDEIVDFSGIEKFIETPVKRYSSGMKVRLAFSVAAHLEPDILVIDEVLAVGDADFQKKCLNKMEDVGSHGRTVLFVSHNMPAVTRLCTRAILMEEGRVVEDGTAEGIVRSYLCSDKGTTAVREWKNPMNAPGGKVARLRAVRVRDKEGNISESVDIREPVTLEMEYEVIKGGRVLMPHMSLSNDNGVTVFVTIDRDEQWRGKPRQEGRYVSRVVIPGDFLNEGMLFVNAHLVTLFPEVRQFAEYSSAAFHVRDTMDADSARGDYSKNMPGIIRPILDWRTDQIVDAEAIVEAAS